MDEDHNEKLDVTKFQPYLDLRDEILAEKIPTSELKFLGAHITEEMLNEKLSKLTFKEIYNLYFGPNLLNQRTVEGNLLKYGPISFFLSFTLFYGTKLSPQVAEEFIKRHRATAWTTPFTAKRKYMDHMLSKTFIKGAKKSLPLTTVVCGLLFLPTMNQLYLRRSVFWDYGLVGCLMGSLYCFFRGPAAMLTGGLVLGIPSFLAGSLIHVCRHWTNTTMEDNLRIKMKEHLVIEETIRGLNRECLESL